MSPIVLRTREISTGIFRLGKGYARRFPAFAIPFGKVFPGKLRLAQMFNLAVRHVAVSQRLA